MESDGPFDSDEASDGIAEIEEQPDVAQAMSETLQEFVEDNQDFVEEGYAEAALAIACLVGAKLSGIAPDETAHHWLDRNPFEATEELRLLAKNAFELATRTQDNYLREIHDDESWNAFIEYMHPYRKALDNEAQEAPPPFVPNFSDPKKPWLEAAWSTEERSLSRNTPYAQSMDRLIEAINEAPDWRAWWQSVGLQVLRVFGHLTQGAHRQRISRGRTSAEAWIDYGHTHDAASADSIGQLTRDDLGTALKAAQEHLRLRPHPAIPADTSPPPGP